MDRLTTDNPETNLQALLNYAYAKDKSVHLAFGNGEDNIPLDEYIAHEACKHGCPQTPGLVMEGGCMECDCPIAILNAAAIQAAELRGRLKMIEDILGDTYDLDHLRELMEAEKEGRLIVMPCSIDSPVYLIHQESGQKRKPKTYRVDECDIDHFTIGETMIPMITAVSKDNEWHELIDGTQEGYEYWLTREAAEAALAKMKEE